MDESKDQPVSATEHNGPAGHPPSGTPDTIITPLKLTAGVKGTGQSAARRKTTRTYASIISVFLLLIAGGLWLFSYLSRNPLSPDLLQKQREASQQKPKELLSTTPPQATVQEGQAQINKREQEEAEQKLADFLKVKKELDAKGVSEWGGERYQQLLQLSQKADAALMQEAFADASEGYAQASARALSLKDSIDDVLRDTLAQGQRALTEGDGKNAERLFILALMIEPLNPLALRNLERAKNCEKVAQLIKSAAVHESGKNLSLAAADYREASRLDPESEEAQAGLARVNGLIASQKFGELLSQGMAALRENDYARARSLLLKAQSFKPGSPEVKDALAQADAALKRARINELQAQATAAERSEDWNQALAAYQSVLSIDGSIQFALQGRERTLKRKTLEEGIGNYLARPILLETDQSLNKATALLSEARQMEPRGSRLSRLIGELDALITAARTPVPVTIESDGMTEVVIYKVGRLGRFQSKELTLRPGTYTITGARTGYKDVRHSLSVKAGTASLRFTVSCNEKI